MRLSILDLLPDILSFFCQGRRPFGGGIVRVMIFKPCRITDLFPSETCSPSGYLARRF